MKTRADMEVTLTEVSAVETTANSIENVDEALFDAIKNADLALILDLIERDAVLIDYPDEDDLKALKTKLDMVDNTPKTAKALTLRLLENGTPEDIVRAVAKNLKININHKFIDEHKTGFGQVSKDQIFRDTLKNIGLFKVKRADSNTSAEDRSFPTYKNAGC